MNIILCAGINITLLFIKKMKLFEDSKYKYCHKIIPFIRPLNTSLLNFYSTISSYLYHQDIYDQIDESNINTPQEIVYSVVNSIVSISYIEPCYYKYSIPLHLCKYVGLNEFIPIIIDFLFSKTFSKTFSNTSILYIFVLVCYIKPFNNMNPLVTHVLLLLMRY